MANRRAARTIMFQGTGSNVGKSILVAGLARALANRGHAVRPFKPQNMSNNAAVADDGRGEIGRAQALQARAARIASTVDMNPVLLKPSSDIGSQIVLQGQVVGSTEAREFQTVKAGLLPKVLESFETVKADADFVLVEGAGSASETNLRKADIANMGFAIAADVPVILIGDIDRGGVIASLVGTHTVLDATDRAMIAGFVVNKMRGDLSLFDDGMQDIAERTGWPALGLIPFFDGARHLPAEDAYDLADRAKEDRAMEDRTKAFLASAHPADKQIRVAVPLLPRIANFDDLDPLAAEPGVDLVLVDRGSPIPMDCDVIILPGSKATIADLASIRKQGWDIDLHAHHRRGGRILGLCGGFQMLGRTIADPDGLEGPPTTVDGLGLLDVETVLKGPKQVVQVSGRSLTGGAPVTGYEIHMGRTTGPDMDAPLFVVSDTGAEGESEDKHDGAKSPDGRIAGSYLHGMFSGDAYRKEWLASFGVSVGVSSHDDLVDRTLDALAAHLETHVDIDRLIALAR